MCVDANAAQRQAARERAAQKNAIFAQEKLKYFNKEASFSRALDTNLMGYGRDVSDAYVQALYTQGKGRSAVERAARTYFATAKVNEGGRSRKFGVRDYQTLLQKRAEVDAIVDTTFGRNFAYFQEGARRKYQASNVEAREALGLPATYGAPVMMPPTNRLGGALQIAQAGLSIATSAASYGQAGGFASIGKIFG